MLPSTITEGVAPNITVTIHSVQTPMMLDTGAELSVIPRAMLANFDPPVPLPATFKEVRTFGNNQVTLRGPLPIELQLCGMRVRHPFYFIDVPTPVIGGYDLIRAARLVIDADNRLVWSRRPESTTLGLVGSNPTVPVPNGSIYSGMEMTRPECGSRVGNEDLPDQVHRALADRPEASAPGCTLRVNKSSTRPTLGHWLIDVWYQLPVVHSGSTKVPLRPTLVRRRSDVASRPADAGRPVLRLFRLVHPTRQPTTKRPRLSSRISTTRKMK